MSSAPTRFSFGSTIGNSGPVAITSKMAIPKTCTGAITRALYGIYERCAGGVSRSDALKTAPAAGSVLDLGMLRYFNHTWMPTGRLLALCVPLRTV